MTRASRLLPLVLIGLIGLVGCSTAFDLERARQILRPRRAPVVPVLVETPAAELPGPENLRAESGELRAIPLKWDPVLTGEVAGYVVERSVEAEGPFQRISTVPGRFQTSFVDRGPDLAPKRGPRPAAADLGDGNAYHYRVRAYSHDGRIAADASPLVTATTVASPEPPPGLRAYSHLPGSVALSWNAPSDASVTAYALYRSPSAGGEFLPIDRIEGRFSTTYVDRELGALRVFYYRLAALNGAGGEGEPTAAVRAVTKPEPLPPVALEVSEQRLGANTLRWGRNVEPDIAGYRLVRIRAGKAQVVATLDADQTSAVDAGVGASERLSYHLVAFDAHGLESTRSDAIAVESVGYRLQAVAEGSAVRLGWDAAVHDEFEAALILRAGRLSERELAVVSEPSYRDPDVLPGKSYRYRVVLMRADGSKGPPSLPVEVSVPEAPGVSGP